MNQGVTEFMLAMGLESRMVGTAYLDDAIWPRYTAEYNAIPVLASGYVRHDRSRTARRLLCAGVVEQFSPLALRRRALKFTGEFGALLTLALPFAYFVRACGVPLRTASCGNLSARRFFFAASRG